MFITRKRHEREKLASFGVNSQVSEAILRHVPQGVFLLDAKDRVAPPVSRSLNVLFRRQDFSNLSFEKLLKPVVSATTLNLARMHLKALRCAGNNEAPTSPLKDVEVRLPNPDGTFDTAYYSFEFNALDAVVEAGAWMVRVTDTSVRLQQAHELDELRGQLRVHAEVLRALMRMGSARLGAALQHIDDAMTAIDAVLKKPARETEAFRDKLEEILDQIDEVRRQSVALKFSALQAAARRVEDALHELRNRSALSGTDFLPLAVQLDEVTGQFAQLRALIATREPVSPPAADAPAGPAAAGEGTGTEIMAAPKFVAQMAAATAAAAAATATAARIAPAPRRAAKIGVRKPESADSAADPAASTPAGAAAGLAQTLASLTEVIAHEHCKAVVIDCSGLERIPAFCQTTVKNIIVQLIRNAVVHGIETAAQRRQAGKSEQGHLRVEVSAATPDEFELTFDDDGRGLDADMVRQTAVAKGLISGEAAAKLRDRQAIKLIFKSGFTTVPTPAGESPRGSGLAVVRRYVHQAGGKIALASLPGHETRFKITMPAVQMAKSGEAQVA